MYGLQAERAYISHTGWRLCSLCYQFNTKTQQIRRVSKNSLHHYYFMQELQNIENYAKRLVESDGQHMQMLLGPFGEDECEDEGERWVTPNNSDR